MKKIGDELKGHLKKTVTTIANCWLISLKDGSNIGFTDYSHNLQYDNVLYYANHTIAVSTVESNNSFSADNFEMEAVLNSEFISDNDLLSGRYNRATIEYFIVNYKSPEQGRVMVKKGYIYEIRLHDNKFFADVRSINYELNKQTRPVYSETCRAKFKSKQCGVSGNNHIICVSIVGIQEKKKIVVDSVIKYPDLYNNAVIRFLLPNNEKKENRIIGVSGNVIFLHDEVESSVNIGNKVLLFPECNKSFLVCCNIFDNALNFRGEPHVPGFDEMNKTAGTFK